MSLETDIVKFTSLVEDWAGKLSDTFVSNTAADVTIKVLDANGAVVDITIPNHKKLSDVFETWKAATNVVNTAGTVTDDAGAALNIDKFGGLTLAEYGALYTNFQNTTKIKLVPIDTDRGMMGYDKIAFVTENNQVIAWGEDNEDMFNVGHSNIMYELQQAPEKQGVLITKLWVCGQHIAILYSDGDLYMRGQQELGHFGIGNVTNQMQGFVFSHANVVDYYSCATGDQDESPMAACILTNGNVVVAGDNGHGELGIGSQTNTYSWVNVYTNPGNDAAVKCKVNGDDVSSFHLLTETGRLFASGYNGYGQLGFGNTTQTTTLTQISLTTNGKIIDVAASGYYDATYTGTTFLLTDTGRVYSTGYNGQGQCCSGNVTQKNSFSEIVYPHNVATDPIISIHPLNRTFFFRTTNKHVYSVGENNYGQLGIGTTGNRSTAQLILSNITRLFPLQGADASQYDSVIALTTTPSLAYGWGQNDQGHLGISNDEVSSNSPKRILFNHFAKLKDMVITGYANSLTVYYVLEDGSLYGVGDNEDGQLAPYHIGGFVPQPVRIRL